MNNGYAEIDNAILAKSFSKSTFLVTGASGMVGRNVVANLLRLNEDFQAGIHIIAQVRDIEKAKRVFASLSHEENLELLVCDIRELSELPHFDWAVHTAGVTGGSKKHVDYPLTTIEVALDGTRRVLDLARANNARGVVFLSTLEIYGTMSSETGSISESQGGFVDPMSVRSSYPESKRMCECLCAAYASQYGLPTYVARLGITFGSGVSYSDGRVFAQFARCVIEKKDIVLKSLGDTVRSYCDVEDTASALLVILARGKSGEAYNITNENAVVSIKELAELFIDLFPESGTKLEFDLADDITSLGYRDTVKTVLDATKLYSLGWRPQYSLSDTVKHLVESMSSERLSE